jgi:hypothetical protein
MAITRMGVAPLLPLIFALSLPACGEDSCTLAALQGPYGSQLSGETTITGNSKPVTALGRLMFDGDGAVSGYSSVMFGGFLLRNPVTGTYDTHSDCTVSWALQDDSGGFQHFSGTFTPDGKRVEFRQTDPGGAQHGIMERTKDDCKAADLQQSYKFTLSGSSFPMAAGEVSSTVALKGVMAADVNGNFKLTLQSEAPVTADVTVNVESDCTMQLEFMVPVESGGTGTSMKLRGILVNGGNEILAIQTDPGWMVSGKFTAH